MKKAIFQINLLVYIFIILCMVVLFNDYFCYFLKINYYIGLVISCFLTILGCFFLRKKVKIKKLDLSKTDIIFFALLFFIMAITIVFPDRMYDSLNYHLYSQVRPFNIFSNGDFFPSSDINSYTYSFPDRVLYIFRLLFGYRLGLIFNYFCLIIIYYQIKELLKLLNVKNDLLISLIGVFSIFNLSIIDLVDSYYVDFFPIIMSLEIIKIIFDKIDQDIIGEYILYFSLMSGMLFCVKLSNMFFIIIFGIILLFKNYKLLKKVKYYNYFIAIILFVFPFFTYLVYTYVETGNPVFPFYNTIFKSELYPIKDWMDLKYGPKTTGETLLWPIVMMKYMIRANDNNIVEFVWAYGYVVSGIYVLMFMLLKIMKKKIDNNNKYILAFMLFISFLIWSKFVLGYTRYALFMLILSSILFILFIIDVIKYKKYIIMPIILICLAYHIFFTIDMYVYKSAFFSFNNVFLNGLDSYKYNMKYLFSHDVDDIDFESNSVWLSSNAVSGYMILLNDEVPIYTSRLDSENNYLINELNSRIEDFDNIYTVVDAIELHQYINMLNYQGYKFVDYYKMEQPSFLNYNNYLYVFKVEKSNEANPNNYEYAYAKQIALNGKRRRVSFYVGLHIDFRNIISDDYSFAVINSKNEIIESAPVDKNGQLNYFELELNEPALLTVIDKDKNVVGNVAMVIINYNDMESK